MRIVCSYCLAEMEPAAPGEQEDQVSHGVCAGCLQYFRRQWEGLSLGEYLDRFPEPVLAVDGDGRVIAANQTMAAALGKPRQEVEALLGGDVMECRWARRPVGCGKTDHCLGCSVRNTVERCLATKEDQLQVPTWIDRLADRLHARISVYWEDAGYARLVIEELTVGPLPDPPQRG